MARWTRPRQPNGQRQGAITTRCSCVGLVTITSCYGASGWCPALAPPKVTTASHSSAVWITVYRDRKAVRYTTSSAAPAPCLCLTCGFGRARFVFSPTAKFLKVDTSLKPMAWWEGPSLGNHQCLTQPKPLTPPVLQKHRLVQFRILIWIRSRRTSMAKKIWQKKISFALLICWINILKQSTTERPNLKNCYHSGYYWADCFMIL